MFRKMCKAMVLSGIICIALGGYSVVHAYCFYCDEIQPRLCLGSPLPCPPVDTCVCYGFGGICSCKYSTFWSYCACQQ